MAITKLLRSFSLSQLTARYLKENYLTGLELCGADGQDLSDDYYDMKLSHAIKRLADLTNVDVLETVRIGEAHDYQATDYLRYGFLQLFHQPTRSVQQIRTVYSPGQMSQIFPSNWLRLDMQHSQINLVPYSGTFQEGLYGSGIAYLPFYSTNYVPGMFEVDYTSGFNPDDIPLTVIDAVCKMAVMDILTSMSDLVQPLGVQSQSLSVDGLSQSRSYQIPAFKARLDRYGLDLGGTPDGTSIGLIRQIKDRYFGIGLTAV